MMKHKGTVLLETERLTLRRFTVDDGEAMFDNFFCDPIAVGYSRWEPHENVETTRALIAQYVREYQDPACYNWAITERDTKEAIGRIAVAHLDERVSTGDMSFFIGQAWWHKGYTSEALAAVIKYLFTEIGINRIAGRHDVANPHSGGVMKKCGMVFEGVLRQAGKNSNGFVDVCQYAILAQDYLGIAQKAQEPETANAAVIRTCADLMFFNLRIAMDTVDWNADICGVPAWRYIYHTLHSADKYFINPSTRREEPEPFFHTAGLDYPDNLSDTVLDRDTLYAYYEQVRRKVLDYLSGLEEAQLCERPNGCLGTRLGLALSQFRHMYAHIGILNGITIANTHRYPRVINEGTWRSGSLPGLFDE